MTAQCGGEMFILTFAELGMPGKGPHSEATIQEAAAHFCPELA
jgi:hypothetical protein